MTDDTAGRCCTKCGETKPSTEYYPRTGGGLTHWCKACFSAYATAKRNGDPWPRQPKFDRQQWYRDNRDRRNAARQKRREDPEYRRHEMERDYDPDRWLRAHYKLTRGQWFDLLDAQGGGCAICGRTESPGIAGRYTFHVDHDHACCPGRRSCGKCVRGLLCNHCNPMLGAADDDPAVLRAGAEYLEKWSKRDDSSTVGVSPGH